MAVFQKILELFVPPPSPEEFKSEIIVPAPLTVYEIHLLTGKNLEETIKLNLRCFKAGENYTKYTFTYLLNEPNCLSYRAVTPDGQMVGFVFVIADESGAGHITTIGVAPEHRRRGLADKLLRHAENALRTRGVNTIMLEVRVSNLAAQNLYREFDYSITQRLPQYYNNGEDGFLMIKPLHQVQQL